jgi:RNA polymerase sigma-70 factor (ECF subfamily)
MEQIQQVSSEEMERIFREHNGLVFRAAYRITGNPSDAEDVLQTVFLRLWRRDPGSLAVEKLASYLHRAAVNAALDVVQSRQERGKVALDDLTPKLLADPLPTPEREQAGREIREWLRRAVARLSPQAAEIFALRFFEGLENPEIAAAVGTSTASVAVTLSRTRERIQKEFASFWNKRAGRKQS